MECLLEILLVCLLVCLWETLLGFQWDWMLDCWLGFLWETQLGTLLEILLLERHLGAHSQLLGSGLWDWKLETE